MPILTIQEFLVHLRRIDQPVALDIEGTLLDIRITSDDFADARVERGDQGDTLLEEGRGWQLHVLFEFTADDLLQGIGDKVNLPFEPYLIFRGLNYPWRDTGRIGQNIPLSRIADMLAVLVEDQFPDEFFDRELGAY